MPYDHVIAISVDDDGVRRLEGEHAAVWLGPGEDLQTVDVSSVLFHVNDDVLPAWLNTARVELGHQILERSADGKPIVVEAGYGQYPSFHTISDLFKAFEGAGVKAGQVKWIIVEASHGKRAERNAKRQYGPSVDVFAKYAADGGDLDPDHQSRLEEQGTVIKRVVNDHDDVTRFRADIIAAYEEMYGSAHPQQT